MSATSLDVHSYARSSDVAAALLSAIDVEELERREEDVTRREVDVARRERAIDAVERLHELRGIGSAPVAYAEVAGAAVSAPSVDQTNRRYGFQQAFRVRELDWWTKVLGVRPRLP
jgi:hypothetical protein